MVYLITFLIWLAVSAVLLGLTYALYAAVMEFQDLKESGEMAQRHWLVRGYRYAILYTGMASNTMLNWMFLTVLYFELPHEFMCSDRIQRWVNGGGDGALWFPWLNGHRKSLSFWFANEWLNPIRARHIVLPGQEIV